MTYVRDDQEIPQDCATLDDLARMAHTAGDTLIARLFERLSELTLENENLTCEITDLKGE